MRMWLIRHVDQTYSRPLPEPVLVAKIEAGDMDRKDEICASGEYWFPVHEVEEVRKFLGNIQLEAVLSGNRGSTSTTLSGEVRESTRSIDPVKIMEEAKKAKPMVIRLKPVQAGVGVEPPPPPELKLPDEESASAGQQLFLVSMLVFIFFGIVYLLWVGSK